MNNNWLYKHERFTHYYGNIVRKLFLAAGVMMLFFLPFFNPILPVSIQISLILILILGIVSGLINPEQMWVSVVELVVAAVGMIMLGYFAVDSYQRYTIRSLFFWINQLLAGIFLVAFYYSVKTIRGKYLSQRRF